MERKKLFLAWRRRRQALKYFPNEKITFEKKKFQKKSKTFLRIFFSSKNFQKNVEFFSKNFDLKKIEEIVHFNEFAIINCLAPKPFDSSIS